MDRRLRQLILILVPLVVILGAVRLLASDAYLSFEYGKKSFPADRFGFTPEERLGYARENFRYVREKQPVEVLEASTYAGRPLYNERETGHMVDVQSVYVFSRQVWWGSLGLLVLSAGILFRRPDGLRRFGSALKVGGLVTAALVLAAGVLAVTAWQAWFLAFHQAFFQPGTWVFDPSDTLIRLFPETFWFDSALTVSVLSFVGGMLVFAAGAALARKGPNPTNQPKEKQIMKESCHVEPVQKAATPAERQVEQRSVLSVWGMGCPNCAARVRNSLVSLHGVVDAAVDHEAGTAEVLYNPDLVGVPALIAAVSLAGNDGRHRYYAQLPA
jgi:integral membrane protein (TIGR01906 family)